MKKRKFLAVLLMALTTTVALTSCEKDEDPEPTPATKTTMTMSKVGQFYHVAGLEKGAYNLVEDKEMGALETNSAKDMVNIDTAGGVFTGSWSVGTGNTTMFVKSNAFDYANATVEAADSAYSAGTATATVNDPAVNDIYIAKLRGGADYAVVRVTEVDPNFGASGNKGKISFQYKKK